MIVRPEELEGVVASPWMGWGLWAGPIYFDGTRRTLDENTVAFGDDAPLFGWVLVDWMWADLEPREDEFEWDELDAVVDYWAARGKQVNLRVWVTDDPGWDGAPGADEVCPNWVYEAGLRYHSYVGEGGAPKREPDYADPSYQTIYLPSLQRFLSALAERYDTPGNPLNFLGCMGYGQWGEWHTMWSGYVWPSVEVKHRILAQVVEMYADTFQNTDIAISSCFDTLNFGSQVHRPGDWAALHASIASDKPEDFKYRQALDVAMDLGFLLGRHGFIDGLEYVDRLVMEAEWRHRAMYAEANWSYLDVKDHGTHGTMDEFLDVMLEWHSNYAHFYMDAASYRRSMREDREVFERGLLRGGLGFRLALTQAAYPDEVAPGQLLLLRQRWVNRNVGRCYRRHPLKLSLTDQGGREVFGGVDDSFDQTGWVQGSEYELTSVFHLPASIPEGEYDVCIGMTDSTGVEGLPLAISGEGDRNRYRLGAVRVTRNADRRTHWTSGW